MIQQPVGILAGHTPGEVPDPRRKGRCEYDWNAEVVERVGSLCHPATATVIAPAGAPESGIYWRQHYAQRARCGAVIEVHHNLTQPEPGDYVLIMYDRGEPLRAQSRRLAIMLRRYIDGVRGQWARRTILAECGAGTAWGRKGALADSPVPAVILECASMDCTAHDVYFERATFRSDVARMLTLCAAEWAQ